MSTWMYRILLVCVARFLFRAGAANMKTFHGISSVGVESAAKKRHTHTHKHTHTHFALVGPKPP